MAVKYDHIQSMLIIKEARESKNICGVLKKYGLSQRDFDEIEKKYGSSLSVLKTVVKSMFLSDKSRNPVISLSEGIILEETDYSNLRIMQTSDKMFFKSNLVQHNFYMNNIHKFQSLHFPCAPWYIPTEKTK